MKGDELGHDQVVESGKLETTRSITVGNAERRLAKRTDVAGDN